MGQLTRRQVRGARLKATMRIQSWTATLPGNFASNSAEKGNAPSSSTASFQASTSEIPSTDDTPFQIADLASEYGIGSAFSLGRKGRLGVRCPAGGREAADTERRFIGSRLK
jgi:hypothetical protein